MPSGFRRKRSSGDEYVFVDGKAMRSSESLRIEVDDSAASVPGQEQAHKREKAPRAKGKGSTVRDNLKALDNSDALEVREDAAASLSLARSEKLFKDERAKMRRKYLVFGGVLFVLVLFSLCISAGYYGTINNPLDVLQSYAAWFRITFTSFVDADAAERLYYETMQTLPVYSDACYTFLRVFKYVACGVLLALSGMLYQNTFRNPIAAPSMLGVSNGINAAILILVLQFGYAATQMIGLYYLYSFVGGVLILLLVMLGGAYISGKGRFNVVNMLLVGTIISQLLGVILTYVQNTFMDEGAWDAYYLLQTATGLDTPFTFVTIVVGGAIALIPVILFRFRLNLVSFDDAETRMLGVDANKLRIIALACGSLMILVAQVNAGQVAMASLVIPYVVRAVFGAEFRKQLVGNMLCGALILLLAADIVTFIAVSEIQLDVGSVVTVCALPLFVWMIAVGQRGWE